MAEANRCGLHINILEHPEMFLSRGRRVNKAKSKVYRDDEGGKITLPLSIVGDVECFLDPESETDHDVKPEDETHIYSSAFNIRVSDKVDFEVEIRVTIMIANERVFIAMMGESGVAGRVATEGYCIGTNSIKDIRDEAEITWNKLLKDMFERR